MPKLADLKKLDSAKAMLTTGTATIIDSGATQHMFKNWDAFKTMTERESMVTSANVDGPAMRSTHIGTVQSGDFELNDVLYVPKVQHNLISVKALNQARHDITFTRDGSVISISDDAGGPVKIGELIGNLFHLTNDKETYLTCGTEPIGDACSTKPISEYILWHNRLGHPGKPVMKLVTGLESDEICISCEWAKLSRKPFGQAKNRSTELISRIHSDLCGPITPSSLGGAQYLLTFIDDATRYATVYFLQHKSDTYETFVEFKTYVETQTGNKLKILRSDGEGEYVNDEMQQFLKNCGIKHETTVPGTPQQNGVAERYNQTIFEAIRAIKLIPDHLWAELATTAAYLRNRLPTKANKDSASPYELWHNQKPDISDLRVIWADAYVHIPKNKRKSKLAPRAR